MTISNAHIRAALGGYLDRYPDERDDARLLAEALEAEHELSSRKEFRIGHATAGAIVLDPDGRVLMIHHNALDTWLLPGGHLEPEDGSLYEASLRELAEETGIAPDHVESDSDPLPVDIDIHRIPDSPTKGEPAHWHFDFRFLFRTRSPRVRLQAEEVGSHAWNPPGLVPSQRLAAKLSRPSSDQPVV
jgi:8-oxo-dGTP pyrophosphatase MutT (NUDIX family)